jgi:4-amino-4-deoxy-L-arabinose transferase-like glycosyltransferase
LLGAGLTAAFIFAAVLILVVPPNNNDSLSTHLSRVGYWLQHGSFFPWPTPRIYQLIYPVNAQLQLLWTILFWGSDQLAGFVQWFAALGSIVAVFGLARLLGWKPPQATFASLIYASFPQVLLQATSTQNDLIIANLFAVAVYFMILGLQKRHRACLVLSALSLGLGFGTKQTIYFLLPCLGILFLFLWYKYGFKVWRDFVYWGIACVTCFMLFAAYLNAMVWYNFGNPFGPPDVVQQQIERKNPQLIINHIRYNVPRLLYQAADTCGLPGPIDGYAHKVKMRIAKAFFNAIGFSIEGTQYTAPKHVFNLAKKNLNEEDYAWYGPLSVLLLFPAMVFQFAQGVRSREPIRAGLVLNALVFLLIDSFVRPGWDIYQGRYFMPVVVLNAPLMASLFQDKGWSRFLRYTAVGLALMVVTVTMLYNPAKPIAGKRATWVNIWSADRVVLQTLQAHRSRQMLQMVDALVPDDATLGLYTSYMLDYPLFGEHFTRRLIPIYPFDKITDDKWLNEQGIEYILVQGRGESQIIPPNDLEEVKGIKGWTLYTWRDK